MEWMKICDKAMRGESVIIAVRNDKILANRKAYMVGEAYYHNNNWWWANTQDGDYLARPITDGVTYWQPLPTPPEEY